MEYKRRRWGVNSCMQSYVYRKREREIRRYHPYRRPKRNEVSVDDIINDRWRYLGVGEIKQREVKKLGDLIECLERVETREKLKRNIELDILLEYLRELNGMIGMSGLKESIVHQLLYYLQDLHDSEKRGEYMHMVLMGAPGTGKTEIAMLLAKIYTTLGIVKSDNIRKVTRSDLIAGYLGQTALKTRELVESSLDGVLFIDEAYSLGNGSNIGGGKDQYSKECLDTLCELLSFYRSRIVVIVAGYENELYESFFDQNQGLKSRFMWWHKLSNYTGMELCEIYKKKVKEIDWMISSEVDMRELERRFEKKRNKFENNGRDVEHLLLQCKIVHSRRIFEDGKRKRELNERDIKDGFEMYDESRKREKKEKEDDNESYRHMYC